MPVKSDSWIIKNGEEGMIAPFTRGQVKKVEFPNGSSKNVLSFGVSSYGYDMRLGTKFRLLKPNENGVIDPKNIDQNLYEDFETTESFLLPAHGLVLAQTAEYFKIPREILTICFGKSTYARCGIFVNVTPFEPEWEGFATISLSNLTALPVRIYAGEGVAQLIFLESDQVCDVSYRDKKGKYQAQTDITTAKV